MIEIPDRLDLGIGVTFLTETLRHEFAGASQQPLVKRGTRLRKHQLAQEDFRYHHFTHQLHVGYRVFIALFHGDGHEHVFLVR